MKILLRYMSAALVAVMLLGVFASCNKEEPTPTPSTDSESQTTLDSESESESQSGNEGEGGNEGGEGNEGEGGNEGGDGNERINMDIITVKSVNIIVKSFNIRYKTADDTGVTHWDSRKQAVYDYINGQNASIVCMQEVSKAQKNDLSENITTRFDMVWYGRTDGTSGEGLAIAYDKSLWNLVEQGCFWLSETPDTPSYGWGAGHKRICVTALLEHKETGARLMVFNVHLDHAVEAARVNGISLVMQRIKACEYPVYLCGDFNCTPESEAYAISTGELQDAQMTALDSDEGSTFIGWNGTITDADQYVIDYCMFTKGNIVPLVYEICDGKWGENNENQLSDHNPLEVTIRLIYDLEKNYPDTTEGGFDCNMDTVSAE